MQPALGRRQRQLTTVMVVLLLLSVLALPVAYQAGAALQVKGCESWGTCRTADEFARSCTHSDRSVISGRARGVLLHEPLGDTGAGITQFADGTTSVMVDGPDRASGGETLVDHSFPDTEAAMRFLVARHPEERAGVDRTWGFFSAGQGRGTSTLLDRAGLSPLTSAAPAATLNLEQPEGRTEIAFAHTGGQRSSISAGRLPWQDASSLNRLAAWLGLAGSMSVRVDQDAQGTPRHLEISGLSRQDWELHQLDSTRPKTQKNSGIFVHGSETTAVRTYTLDLRKGANRQTFTGIFDRTVHRGATHYRLSGTTPEAQAIENLADRLRSDATYRQMTYVQAPVDTGEEGTGTRVLLGLVAGLPVAADFTPRLRAGESKDLAVPHSRVEPFVNCDGEA